MGKPLPTVQTVLDAIAAHDRATSTVMLEALDDRHARLSITVHGDHPLATSLLGRPEWQRRPDLFASRFAWADPRREHTYWRLVQLAAVPETPAVTA